MRMQAALGEAVFLEPVDEPGDVRRVALPIRRRLARLRLVGVEGEGASWPGIRPNGARSAGIAPFVPRRRRSSGARLGGGLVDDWALGTGTTYVGTVDSSRTRLKSSKLDLQVNVE
jgi:hypothetical protein